MTRKTKPHLCTCGEKDPAAFYKSNKSKCKKCVRAVSAKRYAANPDLANAASKKWAAENPEKVKKAKAKWHAENAEHVNEARAKYRAENPEKIKETRAKWHAANPGRRKEINEKWRAKNLDRVREARAKWKAKNAEHVKETNAKYRVGHPEKINAHASKRRAIKLQATPVWELGNTELGVEKHTESVVLTKSTDTKYHVDHTIPLQGKLVCGLHTDANLKVLPAVENLQKSNKFDVAEFNGLPEALPEEQEWFDFFLQEKKHHDELLKELKL